MTNIIFLSPYLDSKIWGGTRLSEFGYNLPNDHIGEAYLVSGIKGKSSKLRDSIFPEKDLSSFFKNHHSFFGNYQGEYPLLTKIIDANDKLSIQVHPDDLYAKKRHNSLGKTECWYILDCPDNASVVYGLTTTDKETIKSAIEKGTLEQYLDYLPVKKGDIVYVPAGTVHAILPGLLIYEVQQSSELTYRLYDYNRLENGSYRELMVDDALNVLVLEKDKPAIYHDNLLDYPFFKLATIEVKNEPTTIEVDTALWLEITCIKGSGKVDGLDFKKGDTFLVRHKHTPVLTGDATCLMAYVEK